MSEEHGSARRPPAPQRFSSETLHGEVHVAAGERSAESGRFLSALQWDEAVPSWGVHALDGGPRFERGVPGPSLIEVAAVGAGETIEGAVEPDWLAMARWSNDPAHRTSLSPSGDGLRVETDVVHPAPGANRLGLRLRLSWPEPLEVPTRVRFSVNFTAPAPVEASSPAPAAASVAAPDPAAGPDVGAVGLLLPLSQRAHAHRDEWGGGGRVWCSPTSLAMVSAAWGARLDATPAPSGDGEHADPRVPWTAARVYDAGFEGAGNWAFNVAAAAEWGLEGFVTRLHGLEELGRLTRAGFPVVASISFGPDELPGADYVTRGHLLVCLGLTTMADGSLGVRVADPACDTPREGLRVYPAEAFDRAWGHSRRAVYVLHPHGVALPEAPLVDGARAW